MHEQQLKDVLGYEEIPPADDNARKQAINLALAAFNDAQQDKRKKRQGFRLLGRLTGRTNSPTGRIETVMGSVVLLVAIGFVVFAFQSSSVSSISGYQVSAEFDNTSGLVPGSEVRMSGVKIGAVASQRLDPETFFAVVTLNISESIKLPSDTSARIIADGLLGSNFIALEPGGDEETIPSGGEITFTQGSINVVDLLGRFIFSAAEVAGEKTGQFSAAGPCGPD